MIQYAGWHLTYDGIVDERHAHRLKDVEFLSSFLTHLVAFLDMEILLPPVVKTVPLDETKMGTGHDDGGISAICMLTTSHTSIHTWPLHNRFSLDVFSCKKFDGSDTEAYIANSMGVVRRSSHFFHRIWP